MKTGSAIFLSGAMAIAAATFAVSANAADTVPNDVKFNEMQVTESLTGMPGDPAAGADAFKNRKLGNCLACHTTAAMESELFHGNVGPDLDGAGSRWTEAQLRAIVVDAKQVFGPDSRMPGFYSLHVGKNVAEKFQGKTILSAQDVENIVAFLVTLKDE